MIEANSIIEAHRYKMRFILMKHIKCVQDVARLYKKNYNPKIQNKIYDTRLHDLNFNESFSVIPNSQFTSSSSSSSSSLSSSSSDPKLLPMLLNSKNANILKTVDYTMKKVDKTLYKHLKKTKNKQSLGFKILFVCRKLFTKIKKPIYTLLGILGVYTSLTHFLYIPDNICEFIASSSFIEEYEI